MKLSNIIEGLTILSRYYDKPDGYHNSAYHEILYAYSTDKPVSTEDVARLADLGWRQPDASTADDEGVWEAGDYDPNENWAAYV